MSPNKTSLCKTPTESKSIDCVDQTSSAKEQQERPSAPRTVLLTSFFKCRAREPPMLPMTQTTPAPQLKPGLADQEVITDLDSSGQHRIWHKVVFGCPLVYLSYLMIYYICRYSRLYPRITKNANRRRLLCVMCLLLWW